MTHFFVEANDQPMLVKFCEHASYLPVFKREADAEAWRATLNVTTTVRPFSFEAIEIPRRQMKNAGHMVFLHPVGDDEFTK